MNRIRIFGLDLYGCQEALERLDDYIDRELSPEETSKVAQHLKICHTCARKFKFEADLTNGIRTKVLQIAGGEDIEVLKQKVAAALEGERGRS